MIFEFFRTEVTSPREKVTKTSAKSQKKDKKLILSYQCVWKRIIAYDWHLENFVPLQCQKENSVLIRTRQRFTGDKAAF